MSKTTQTTGERSFHLIDMVTDQDIHVALAIWPGTRCVYPGSVPALPVTYDQRRGLGVFACWTWAILFKGVADVVYTFPAQKYGDYAAEQTWATSWYLGDDELLGAILAEAWHWQPGDTTPAICVHLHATPGLIQSAIARWRTDITPAAAQIIQGLYCSRGNWATLDEGYTDEWAGAAAKLAHCWLTFYQHNDAPKARDHIANRLKLQRIAALALAGWVLGVKGEATWIFDRDGGDLDNQPYALTSILANALERWQTICLDETHAWVFDQHWWVAEEQSTKRVPRQRIERRADEINLQRDVLSRLLARTTIADADNRAVGDLHYRLIALLETLARDWYRATYDLQSAEAIERETRKVWHLITYRVKTPRRWQPFTVMIRGPLRLYAGTLVGFLATSLASDTWALLYSIAVVQNGIVVPDWFRFSLLVGFGLVCAVVARIYLVNGIRARRVVHAAKHAKALFWKGEGFATCVSGLLAFTIGPLLASDAELFDTMQIVWWHHAAAYFFIAIAGLIYAQVALFLGIFTQLVFDEKPATARIDPP